MSSPLSRPSLGQDTHGAEILKTWNCTNCRRRKVRCDRHQPCLQCTRNKLDCTFPVSGRLPRRRAGPRKQSELSGRLRRLEAMIGDLGSQVERTSGVDPNRLPSANSAGVINGVSSEADTSVDMDFVYGQQPDGNSSKSYDRSVPVSDSDMYGNNNMPHVTDNLESVAGAVGADKDGHLVVKDRFWSVFCKEVEEIFESIHGPMSDQQFEEHSRLPAMSISNHQPGSRFHNLLLRHTSAARLADDAWPHPSQMAYLWRIYVERVDPFVKILHVPSMAQIIHEIRDDYKSLSPSMHALVMAVAFAAVMSLDDAEVCENFDTSKDETLSGYRLATETSLERVDLLDKPEMPAVQALTLYLSVLQTIGETKSAWVLIGSLARSAASLRSYKNNMKGRTSNAFEEQMQRRLWGQISFLDSRPQGVPMSENSFSDVGYNVKAPENLNDMDLHPEMTDTPADAEGWTDTTIFMIHHYIRRLSFWLQDTAAKHAAKLVRPEERKNLIEETIEVTYLQHGDPNNPLHCFVAASTRLFMAKVELVLQAKQRSLKTFHRMPTVVEESPNTEVFDSAFPIIELTYRLQNEPKWKGWRWQLHGHRPPYQAIRVVLTHLCTNPLDPRYNRTLSVVRRTLNSVTESARRDPAHSLVVDLLASAAQRRQACTIHDAGVQTDNPPSSFRGSDDLTSENALNSLRSSAPRGDAESRVQKGGPASSSTSQEQEQEQEPIPRITPTTSAGNTSDETLALEMDWEELVREMEPCLEAWNAYG